MKILIDEMLSPTLVERLADVGVVAQHIVHLDRSGVSDPELWKYAYEHDQVVVTMNCKDFMVLAAGSDLHTGLIVLREGGLSREEQWEILHLVIENVKDQDLVNKVVEVDGSGRFSVRDIPPGA